MTNHQEKRLLTASKLLENEPHTSADTMLTKATATMISISVRPRAKPLWDNLVIAGPHGRRHDRQPHQQVRDDSVADTCQPPTGCSTVT